MSLTIKKKTCSCCGHIQPMPLKERIFNCGSCGQIIDHDLNGVKNLENWKVNADGLSVNACGQEVAEWELTD